MRSKNVILNAVNAAFCGKNKHKWGWKTEKRNL